jgi:hypothetical protein
MRGRGLWWLWGRQRRFESVGWLWQWFSDGLGGRLCSGCCQSASQAELALTPVEQSLT